MSYVSPGENLHITLEPIGVNLLERAFSEAVIKPHRPFYGSYRPQYNFIWNKSNQRLQQVHTSLNISIFCPPQQIPQNHLYDGLSRNDRAEIALIRQEEKREISNLLTEEVIPTLSGQSLQLGVLTAPSIYHSQESAGTCLTANVRMVLEEITGREVKESDMLAAARKNGMTSGARVWSGELIQTDLALGLLESQTFKKELDVNVMTFDLYEVDFENIARIVNDLKKLAKQRGIDAQCFFLATVTAPISDGQHSVILLSSHKDSVTVHDPLNPPLGVPIKKYPKQIL